MSDYHIGESIENIYGGLGSSMEASYSTGFEMSGSQMGYPGSPQTANQLGEAVNAVKQGVKAFEVTMLSPDTAETIPKQHFREMRQLMKLSGVKPSVHGAIVDPAGFTQQGWGGDQTVEDNERRMFHSIESAYELDPKGSIPVVFHSSNGAPGGEWRPKNGKEAHKVVRAVINQETGQILPMKEKKIYSERHPEELNPKDVKGSGRTFTPLDQIDSANRTEWDKRMTELATFTKHANDIIDPNALKLLGSGEWTFGKTEENQLVRKNIETGEIRPINEYEASALRNLEKGEIFLENVELNFHSAFDKAFEYGTEQQREELKELAEDYSEKLKNLTSDPMSMYFNKEKILEDSVKKLHHITTPRKKDDEDYIAPKIYMDAEDFAMKKASKTFGNLAFRSYDKYKDKAPVIAIENMFQGFAFSSDEEMKQLIEESREQFADRLVEEKHINRQKAEKIAAEKIGMTLDVGHLNIAKKSGFKDEDLREYTETVAPYVKHLHLTDNFGYADTHLAPGMGNVPFKEILETLEKKGKLKEMRKIVESGNFVQHFKQSPHAITLAAFSSPIYGAKMAPTWNNAYNIGAGYFAGYGMSNPSIHHSIYGSGFTTLPTEFGGNVPGNGSRFSGKGMA